MRGGTLLGAASLVFAACATAEPIGPRAAAPRPAAGARPSGYEVREAVPEAPERDGLQVRMESGFLSQEEAEESVRGSWRRLSRCYDEAGPARDFAGGQVKLRFAVDPRGRVAEVRVVESRLGSFEVERCLVGVGREIVFPRPQGGGTSFEYTLEFRSTGERSVVELPVADVQPLMPALLPHLAADCQRLGADALEATLYIEARGSVRSVGFASAAALDDEAANCVSASIRRWTAPVEALRGGTLGRVTLALRAEDLVAPPPPPRARLSQGRRGRSARR
jgi:hypothetical protein